VKRLADGLWLLRGFPPHAINAYLMGDVLVDAGTRHAHRRILRQLRGQAVNAHALTHVHPDHQGSTHRVCETLGLPLWCPENDVPALEDGDLVGRMPPSLLNRINGKAMAGPPHPVDRPLREGDEVAGFTVLDAPGHTAGHVVFWRESDRVLIAGDVFNTQHPVTAFPGLRLPPDYLTPDPDGNRLSARKLGPLVPDVLLVGHGRPYRKPRQFAEFCSKL